MKQHFMTHKLRGDPGYEEAEESQSASSPDTVGSSTRHSPREEEDVCKMEDVEDQHCNRETHEFFNASHFIGTSSPMTNTPSGKLHEIT